MPAPIAFPMTFLRISCGKKPTTWEPSSSTATRAPGRARPTASVNSGARNGLPRAGSVCCSARQRVSSASPNSAGWTTRTRTMAPSKSSGLGLAPPQSRVDPAAAAQCRDPAQPLMPLPGECVQCQRVLAVGLRQLFDPLGYRPFRTELGHRLRDQVTRDPVVALVGGRALGEGDGATDQF